MKTSELTGAALDWAVAKCEGYKPEYWDDDRLCFTDDWGADFEPSCDWSQGGKIIEREEISINRDFHLSRVEWAAWTPAPIRDDAEAFGYGETPLVAAMRCYVASKLGEEVQLPEGLI